MKIHIGILKMNIIFNMILQISTVIYSKYKIGMIMATMVLPMRLVPIQQCQARDGMMGLVRDMSSREKLGVSLRWWRSLELKNGCMENLRQIIN